MNVINLPGGAGQLALAHTVFYVSRHHSAPQNVRTYTLPKRIWVSFMGTTPNKGARGNWRTTLQILVVHEDVMPLQRATPLPAQSGLLPAGSAASRRPPMVGVQNSVPGQGLQVLKILY